jgi:hydrogenase expression/formation protein HypC
VNPVSASGRRKRRPADDVCITCSDEGVPLVVLAVDEDRGLALCTDPAGAHSTVEIALVEAAPGDTLLVHAGTALLRLRAAGAAA